MGRRGGAASGGRKLSEPGRPVRLIVSAADLARSAGALPAAKAHGCIKVLGKGEFDVG